MGFHLAALQATWAPLKIHGVLQLPSTVVMPHWFSCCFFVSCCCFFPMNICYINPITFDKITLLLRLSYCKYIGYMQFKQDKEFLAHAFLGSYTKCATMGCLPIILRPAGDGVILTEETKVNIRFVTWNLEIFRVQWDRLWKPDSDLLEICHCHDNFITCHKKALCSHGI